MNNAYYLVWDVSACKWKIVDVDSYYTIFRLLANVVDPDYAHAVYMDDYQIWYAKDRPDNIYPISFKTEDETYYKGNLLFSKGFKGIGGLDKVDMQRIKKSVGYEAVVGEDSRLAMILYRK